MEEAAFQAAFVIDAVDRRQKGAVAILAVLREEYLGVTGVQGLPRQDIVEYAGIGQEAIAIAEIGRMCQCAPMNSDGRLRSLSDDLSAIAASRRNSPIVSCATRRRVCRRCPMPARDRSRPLEEIADGRELRIIGRETVEIERLPGEARAKDQFVFTAEKMISPGQPRADVDLAKVALIIGGRRAEAEARRLLESATDCIPSQQRSFRLGGCADVPFDIVALRYVVLAVPRRWRGGAPDLGAGSAAVVTGRARAHRASCP